MLIVLRPRWNPLTGVPNGAAIVHCNINSTATVDVSHFILAEQQHKSIYRKNNTSTAFIWNSFVFEHRKWQKRVARSTAIKFRSWPPVMCCLIWNEEHNHAGQTFSCLLYSDIVLFVISLDTHRRGVYKASNHFLIIKEEQGAVSI